MEKVKSYKLKTLWKNVNKWINKIRYINMDIKT